MNAINKIKMRMNEIKAKCMNQQLSIEELREFAQLKNRLASLLKHLDINS